MAKCTAVLMRSSKNTFMLLVSFWLEQFPLLAAWRRRRHAFLRPTPRTSKVKEPLESVQRCVCVWDSLSASAGAQLLPVRAVDAVRLCGWS